MRRAVLLVLAGVVVSCAGRTRAPAGPTLADANRLATAGCYSCLVEALRIYDGLLARRQSPGALHGAFRTTLLLALREKEMGLSARSHLDRARTLAPSLAPEHHSDLAVAVAEAVPWDQAGLAREFFEEFLKTLHPQAPRRREWHERLRPLRADPLFAYLDVALACAYDDYNARDALLDEVLARHPSSPLLKYRVGICAPARHAALDDALSVEPRYAEARLFLGRYALAAAALRRGRRSAIAPNLEAAYEAFPSSPSVTFTLAGMHRAFNRLQDALRFYDETLTLVPNHREALLGRIIVLTYSGHRDAAIQTATKMIELGHWFLGDAYYWRAYNLHRKNQLAAAHDDVERARPLAGLRPEVFLLAGIIDYDRREFEAAAVDLAKAWQLSDRMCDASWYLGLIRSEERAWDVAAALFARAAGCYGSAAETYRGHLAEALKAAETPEERAAIEAEFSQLIEQQLVGESRSYYNAAYVCAQGGRKTDALGHAERAIRHPVMKEKAGELISALKKSP